MFFFSLKATFRTKTVAESQTNVLNSFLPNINFMNSYKKDFYLLVRVDIVTGQPKTSSHIENLHFIYSI